MIKLNRTYTDYNGVERNEDFYFNLSKAELLEMELSTDGGMEALINRIVNTQDSKELVKIFKSIVLKAYGVKSDDGKRFIKTKEATEAFSQTEAYSDLFVELATDAEAAAEFVNGIVPADMANKIKEKLILFKWFFNSSPSPPEQQKTPIAVFS